MPHSSPPAAKPRRRRVLIVLAALAGAAPILAWQALRPLDDEEPAAAHQAENPPPREQPRESRGEPTAWDALLAASPYRNVRPEVEFVDDAACAECHAEISASYAQHPMGRSLGPMHGVDSLERFAADDRHPLTLDGFVYQVRRDGDRHFHQESRLSPEGEEALATEFEAVYAVGSGRTGRSYFIERDGHLFMSPLTWYTDHGWDLSPGYEVNNSHFNRPVVSECMFCHANRAHHVAGTLNKYETPAFSGHAIGCQRCHGPGELHVAAWESGDAGDKDDPGDAAEADHTIVNPARLEPHLRESVCQQCHLGGLVRVETRGRRREDFRPGLPWSAVEVAFLAARTGDEEESAEPRTGSQQRGSDATGEQPDRFIGHVEQMHQSGCYVGSGGKLGCISCHDPHQLPAESAKVEYYRGRCLECHGEAACSLPLDERRAQQADDSCMACHMPRAETQIRHAAATDHRIPRSPEAPPRRPSVTPVPAWSPLIAFDALTVANAGDGAPASGDAGASEVPAASDPDALRNLAIALTMAMERRLDVVDASLLPRTIELLQQAVRRDPADVRAREALAFSLGRGRDLEPALRQMADVLAREPRRETTLAAAAAMLMSAGQWAAAVELWESARDVNPWIVRYWFEMALCYARMGQWSQCTTTCEQALERFPDSFGARQLLVESRLIAGRFDDAQREYERMIELNPPQVDAVRRWWDNHPLRQQAGRRPPR